MTIDLLASFEDIERALDRLEKVLRDAGINIEPGSPLEDVILSVTSAKSLRVRRRGDTELAPAEVRDLLTKMSGGLHLARLLASASSMPGFGVAKGHLELLKSAAALQNQASGVLDGAANKLFELVMGCAALLVGDDVRLEDPERSDSGRNPDVLATLSDVRWAIACKTIHGDSPMTLFETILGGMKQIERSEAATGVVVLSMKNRMPYSELFPELSDSGGETSVLGHYASLDDPLHRMNAWTTQRLEAMIDHVTAEKVAEELRGFKAVPAVLIYTQGTVGIASSLGPLTTLLGFLHMFTMGRIADAAIDVLNSLNFALSCPENAATLRAQGKDLAEWLRAHNLYGPA